MNDAVFYFFYNLAHRSDLLDQIIVFYAVYFPYLVALLAAIFLIFYYKSLRAFLAVFLSAGLAVLLAKIFKSLIHLGRPFAAFPDIQTLFAETGYAFPSSHATFFFALAVALFFYNKRAGWWFMAFAVLIGLARIMAGVHSPQDILAGFILGGLSSLAVAYLVKRI